MSSSKMSTYCRVCEKPDKKGIFDDIFEYRFMPDRTTEEILLYEAMQQLTGIQVCLQYLKHVKFLLFD